MVFCHGIEGENWDIIISGKWCNRMRKWKIGNFATVLWALKEWLVSGAQQVSKTKWMNLN